MNNWNSPETTPLQPGEYRAVLEPLDAAPDVLRWWSGQAWSNPYFAFTPETLKEKIRAQVSMLRPYWQPV